VLAFGRPTADPAPSSAALPFVANGKQANRSFLYVLADDERLRATATRAHYWARSYARIPSVARRLAEAAPLRRPAQPARSRLKGASSAGEEQETVAERTSLKPVKGEVEGRFINNFARISNESSKRLGTTAAALSAQTSEFDPAASTSCVRTSKRSDFLHQLLYLATNNINDQPQPDLQATRLRHSMASSSRGWAQLPFWSMNWCEFVALEQFTPKYCKAQGDFDTAHSRM